MTRAGETQVSEREQPGRFPRIRGNATISQASSRPKRRWPRASADPSLVCGVRGLPLLRSVGSACQQPKLF